MHLFSIIDMSLFEIGPPYSSPTRLRAENELKWTKKNFFTCANVSLTWKTWKNVKVKHDKFTNFLSALLQLLFCISELPEHLCLQFSPSLTESHQDLQHLKSAVQAWRRWLQLYSCGTSLSTVEQMFCCGAGPPQTVGNGIAEAAGLWTVAVRRARGLF